MSLGQQQRCSPPSGPASEKETGLNPTNMITGANFSLGDPDRSAAHVARQDLGVDVVRVAS